LGSSKRAKTIRDPMRRAKLAPWEQTFAKPPRIALAFKSFIGTLRFNLGIPILFENN
jgi:hypothetical protein